MYEITGKVRRIGDVQTFASGFSKRELVVDEEREGSWPNVVPLVFKQDRASLLDPLGVGAKVKVGFVVDGRDWTDPKTEKVKCFCDLTALKLEVLSAAPTAAEVKGTIAEPADGDMPF